MSASHVYAVVDGWASSSGKPEVQAYAITRETDCFYWIEKPHYGGVAQRRVDKGRSHLTAEAAVAEAIARAEAAVEHADRQAAYAREKLAQYRAALADGWPS